MVWPVPPPKAVVLPSQTARMTSDCSISTRPARATRSEARLANSWALPTSPSASSRARRSSVSSASWSASSNTWDRSARRRIASTRAITAGIGGSLPSSRARAPSAVSAMPLIASFRRRPNGRGLTSSHPRARAISAAIWSTPSAIRVCIRGGALEPGPQTSGAASTADPIRSRSSVRVASIRSRLAAKAGFSARWPVTPIDSRTDESWGGVTAVNR